MDRRHTDPSKNRSSSKTSSTSSVIEYVNEGFEESELEASKVISVQVTDNIKWVKNPLSDKDLEKDVKHVKDLQNFADSTNITKHVKEPVSYLNIRKMYLAAAAVLLFPVCMGMTATYSATATMDMKKPHSSIHPNDDQITWIASLMAIGALVGGSAAGYFTNFLGRKGTLIFDTVPFVFGWLMIAYGQSIGVIYVGRMITGFCCGIVSVATPMYLVEISTPEVRGLLGSSFQLFVVIGVLFISGLGSVMTWRYSAVAGAITSLIAAFLMVPMPESPRWLITQQRRGEAKNAIIFLQGEGYDTEAELYKMEEDIKSEPKGTINLKEFKTPTTYKPFIYSILLMFFQQFSGVNAVLFYCAQIFESARSSMDAIQATIVVATVQVIATFVASLLMDKAGRKILLLISSSCMSISLIVFGIFDFAKMKNENIVQSYGWLPLVCLMTFIAAFSIGFGPAPWLMVAEMTSARLRSLISGVATALNWLFVFTITKLYLIEEKYMHAFGVYWMYSCFCLLSIVFVHFFLPETKGKSLEEIQEHFLKKSRSSSKLVQF